MLRLLFALTVLMGAAVAAPPADALAFATPLVLADGPADTADAQAQGRFCYRQSGRRYCYDIPEGETCSDVQARVDGVNDRATSPGFRIRGFRCFDAARAAFNGQMEGEAMAIEPRQIGQGGDAEPPTGGHTGVFVTYVRDGRLEMVEAGDGSDIGALLVLADAVSDCDRKAPQVSIDVLTTDREGTVTVNGRRIEVEQTPVTVRATRADEYGEVIIHEQPLEDFEYD